MKSGVLPKVNNSSSIIGSQKLPAAKRANATANWAYCYADLNETTLIVTEISRLSRTLTDIMAIMGKCLERGINLYTTKEGYSFDNTINSKVLCFAFGLVAEIERNLISMRTREALALRRAEGMVLGRRHGSYTKMNVLIKNRQVVITMLNKGKSISDICKHFDLSRDTFAKFRMKYPSVQKALDKKEQLRISRFKNKQINA